IQSPILCYRDAIYFGTSDDRFRALRHNGRKKWSYEVGGAVTARPFGLGSRVYFLCYDNYIYALKAQSGNLLLRVRISHRLSDDSEAGLERIYLSAYTSARLTALTLPELQLAGEYLLGLEGEWFTTSPVRSSD